MAKSAKEKNLEKALDFKNKLTEIINIIHDAQDINDIIINTRAKILDLLNAERITISSARER